MVRLQIQLDATQHRRVRRRAKRLGVSVAEVIRRCVDAEIRREEAEEPDARARRALAVAGKYADPHGVSRTAADHDEALADAYNRP
jgi:post-segregation antitoxin (ccd killing protein)